MTIQMKKDTLHINEATGAITGDTYSRRTWIKENFTSAKWDANLKAWVVDVAEIVKETPWLKKIAQTYWTDEEWAAAHQPKAAQAAQVTSTTAKAARVHTGVCPYCHTYCDGDCRA